MHGERHAGAVHRAGPRRRRAWRAGPRATAAKERLRAVSLNTQAPCTGESQFRRARRCVPSSSVNSNQAPRASPSSSHGVPDETCRVAVTSSVMLLPSPARGGDERSATARRARGAPRAWRRSSPSSRDSICAGAAPARMRPCAGSGRAPRAASARQALALLEARARRERPQQVVQRGEGGVPGGAAVAAGAVRVDEDGAPRLRRRRRRPRS